MTSHLKLRILVLGDLRDTTVAAEQGTALAQQLQALMALSALSALDDDDGGGGGGSAAAAGLETTGCGGTALWSRDPG